MFWFDVFVDGFWFYLKMKPPNVHHVLLSPVWQRTKILSRLDI